MDFKQLAAVRQTGRNRGKGEYEALKLTVFSFQSHQPFSGRATGYLEFCCIPGNE